MKISTHTARRFEHDKASANWDDYEAHRAQNDKNRRANNPGIVFPPRRGRAKSAVAGLGEIIRAERASINPRTNAEAAKAKEIRLAKCKFLKAQTAKAYAENKIPYARPVDNCRYFPHQSVREMARRVRQMGG